MLWNQLSSSIRESGIDPISLDCSLSSNEILEKAILCMEGMQCMHARIFTVA